MIQSCGELCFANESVARERFYNLVVQHLDRDAAIMPEIARQIDRGHAAAAKLAFNVVFVGERSPELAVQRGSAHECREGIDANIRASCESRQYSSEGIRAWRPSTAHRSRLLRDVIERLPIRTPGEARHDVVLSAPATPSRRSDAMYC